MYTVRDSKVWQHRATKRRVSIYGACPWTDSSDKANWQMMPIGWTVYNESTGQVGIGRSPCATKNEAQALADQLNSTPISHIAIGD